jgi:hypothetical protein
MDQTAKRSHDICSFIRRSKLFDTLTCIVSGVRFSLKIEFYQHSFQLFTGLAISFIAYHVSDEFASNREEIGPVLLLQTLTQAGRCSDMDCHAH